ncbi:LysR substrate-binding domain-containing protein [Rhizobium sp. S152]|uniref:LysR family transcriptional regulator n=1 Tax=Rhizobium sp. S152 TaxID=3055038 RepID=UPI0025A9FAAE|nr:LysR family transcriptional regulator [Rhizobium sp. S152]MDM9628515.1 LysR substrate-binding domain-containing protein [Rhizobium sp. S152]
MPRRRASPKRRGSNLSQPTVSRTISVLETELGVSLLNRTTRVVSLTDAGADYLARVEPILEAVDDANHAVRGSPELRGVLKLGLTTTFGNRAVIPRLPGFMAQHKALKIEVAMNDVSIDAVSQGIDLAFRPGEFPDMTAVTRRVASIQQVLVASPCYLRKSGAPERPEHLDRLQIIHGPLGVDAGWSLAKGNERVDLKPHAALRLNASEGAIAAAVAGLGVLAVGICSVYPELRSGALVRVVPDWKMAQIDIHAVYPAGRHAKPAARAFVNYFVEDLARNPIPEFEMTTSPSVDHTGGQIAKAAK